MRINQLVKQKRVKPSDQFIIDTNTGAFRVSGEAIKEYTTDIRSASVLAYEAADRKNEYVPVQNKNNAQHTKISIEEIAKNVSQKVDNEQRPSQYPSQTIPSIASDADNMFIKVEMEDGSFRKIALSDFYKYIVPNVPTDSLAYDQNANPKRDIGNVIAYETSSHASNPAYPKVMQFTKQQMAEALIEYFPTLLTPKGSIRFEARPPLSQVQVGWTYNIIEEFVTTDDFVEGPGFHYPAGSNIYKTADGKWDCLGGTAVYGVKGDRELNYRPGNVNLTLDNIGPSKNYLENEDDINDIENIYLMVVAPNGELANYELSGFLMNHRIGSATNAIFANSARSADNAANARHADNADNAAHATNADHATAADSAISAGTAATANNAANAANAENATNAGTASKAIKDFLGNTIHETYATVNGVANGYVSKNDLTNLAAATAISDPNGRTFVKEYSFYYAYQWKVSTNLSFSSGFSSPQFTPNDTGAFITSVRLPFPGKTYLEKQDHANRFNNCIKSGDAIITVEFGLEATKTGYNKELHSTIQKNFGLQFNGLYSNIATEHKYQTLISPIVIRKSEDENVFKFLNITVKASFTRTTEGNSYFTHLDIRLWYMLNSDYKYGTTWNPNILVTLQEYGNNEKFIESQSDINATNKIIGSQWDTYYYT